jgi:hypothetical protein
MPLPKFSEDDVTNFMVTESLVARAAHERQRSEKDRERQDWMKGHKDWAKEVGLAAEAGGR